MRKKSRSPTWSPTLAGQTPLPRVTSCDARAASRQSSTDLPSIRESSNTGRGPFCFFAHSHHLLEDLTILYVTEVTTCDAKASSSSCPPVLPPRAVSETIPQACVYQGPRWTQSTGSQPQRTPESPGGFPEFLIHGVWSGV